MKELSIEEKAARYDKAIEVIRKCETDKYGCLLGVKPTDIFPELNESEDEMVWLTKYLQEEIDCLCYDIRDYKDYAKLDNLQRALAWVVRQGEQKPTDKVKSKFKTGDWIVYNRNDHSMEIIQIYDIRDGRYYFTDNVHFSWSVKECDEKCHLWTIRDAKDGDVLATLDHILIFEKLLPKDGGVSYCHYDFGCSRPQFIFNKDDNWYFGKEAKVYPETKEQRDLLFQKMKEAGYEWDAEKKELRKIPSPADVGFEKLGKAWDR